MSYDLRIWSRAPVPLPQGQGLPDVPTWSGAENTWVREGRGWVLVVDASIPVLPEDIPEEVERALPGSTFPAEVRLSPITAPEAALRLARQVARLLAARVDGIVRDPQTNRLSGRARPERVGPLGTSESASVIAMSWWFVSGPLVDCDAADLIAVLESVPPEALPRRYGTFEPPQYLYAEGGREHLLGFIREHGRELSCVVCAPSDRTRRPVDPEAGRSLPHGLPLRLPDNPRRRRGVAAAGMGHGLAARLAAVVARFYGDVRRLDGFTRKRGRYWSAAQTERHPVCSWWWAGVPAGPVCAAVLGDPCRERWPSFCARSDADGQLCFASTSDWRADADAFGTIGPPPPAIVQPAPENNGRNDRRHYPRDWPFGTPRIAG
ncbi:MAG TPA: hypothetical protein VGX75_09600 [bacterium]|nr:hypothetical protein [bacterium]